MTKGSRAMSAMSAMSSNADERLVGHRSRLRPSPPRRCGCSLNSCRPLLASTAGGRDAAQSPACGTPAIPSTEQGLCPNCTIIADHETGLRGMLGPIPQPVPWYRRILKKTTVSEGHWIILLTVLLVVATLALVFFAWRGSKPQRPVPISSRPVRPPPRPSAPASSRTPRSSSATWARARLRR